MDQRVSQALSPNPLLQDWDTPYGLPPFETIRTEHFVPALRAAGAPPIALALKSGNFGAEDFFEKAFRVLAGGRG